MAYCPSCGREQRCGCEECHTCGVALVEGAGATSTSMISPGEQRQAPAASEPVREATVSGAAQRRVPDWLAHVFVILGIGLLLICIVDMTSAARHFPTMGPFATAAEGLRRIGYYLGILLYTNSARILTGFALVSGGVLSSQMRGDGGGWDKAVRATGLVMGGASIIYFLTAVLLALPFARAPYALQPLLPPLWASIPVLVITGASLFGAGFLMASRLSRDREGFLTRLRRGQDLKAAGKDGESVKSYATEREGGVTR